MGYRKPKRGFCYDVCEDAECFICSACGGGFIGWTVDGEPRRSKPRFCPCCGMRVYEDHEAETHDEMLADASRYED